MKFALHENQDVNCVEEASQKKSITKPLNRLTPKE